MRGQSFSVDIEGLDDPRVMVRLASIFDSIGSRDISAIVEDGSLILEADTRNPSQPQSASVIEVEAMPPGTLRDYVASCVQWWESRLNNAQNITAVFGTVIELKSTKLSPLVTQISSERNCLYRVSSDRWVAKLLQTIAIRFESRVIWQNDAIESEKDERSYEQRRLAITDDRLSVIPTWAALQDLSQQYSVVASGSRSAIALHADAIIASGATVELRENHDPDLVPAGHTLREVVNPSEGQTRCRSVPALAAPAKATIGLVQRARVKSEEPAVLVWAPPYASSSGGIKILYRLAETLTDMGVLAGIMPVGPRKHHGRFPLGFADGRFMLAEQNRRLLHVQPETLNIDVIDAPRIMWELYFRDRLPFSGGLVAETDAAPQKVLTHSRSYSTTDDRLYVCPLDFDSFHPPQLGMREHTLMYFGKSELNPAFQIPNEYRGLKPIMIHRSWPSRPVLSRMLQTAKLLISFDPFTALNAEATICGCPVLIDTRFSDPDAAEALHRYEFGLEGFHFDITPEEVSPIVRPKELWERLKAETAECEQNDLVNFVESVLPEIFER